MSNPARSFASRRWLTAALLVSLALNAFFIGAAATDLIRLFGDEKVHFELRWLEGRLPDAGFDQVAAALAATRPNAEQHIEKLRALRLDLGRLAGVPAPDRTAIDAKLVEIRSELNAMLTEVQGTTINAVLALPPDMRARLAAESAPAK